MSLSPQEKAELEALVVEVQKLPPHEWLQALTDGMIKILVVKPMLARFDFLKPMESKNGNSTDNRA